MENIRKSLVCVFCEQTFSSNEDIQLHLQCHNVPKPFVCIECDLRYAHKSALKRHKAIHARENLFTCPNCKVSFIDEQELYVHSKIHVNANLSCEICDYVCENARSLTEHILAHSSKNSFTCKNCDFRCLSKFTLSRHRGKCTPMNKYECLNCNLNFRFAIALENHTKSVHKKLNTFACTICPSSYSNKGNLNKHMKTHASKDNININKKTISDIEKHTSNNSYVNNVDVNNNNNDNDNDNNFDVAIGTSSGGDDNNNNCDINNNNTDDNENSRNELASMSAQLNNTKDGDKCISCSKKLKLKKIWNKYIFDNRYSFIINASLCELSLNRWKLNWKADGICRICLTCKIELISGNPRIHKEDSRGRTKMKAVGFVTVCSTCHSEVKTSNKIHVCTIGSTKRNIKKVFKKITQITSNLIPSQRK